MPGRTHSRRGFIAAFMSTIVSLATALRAEGTFALVRFDASGHPDPRPGIDASRVLPSDQVSSDLAELYDRIREIPHVVDGVRCYCGCADVEGIYSLLSCYEESGMAQHCEICQGEGRLVHRLHGEGKRLDEIRAAIDRRFA